MARIEVPPNWAGKNSSNVWVVPIVNVEAFSDDEFGPSIQPHLNHSQPEIANSGWRDYGKQQGLRRLGALFKQHSISCTAVVSSDLVQDHFVASQLQRLKNEDGWEIGAHGSNNSTGGHAGLTAAEETEAILDCTKTLEATFGTSQNMTWLTPGFSVTRSTPKLLLDAGVRTLLDFVDDDRPFLMKSDEENSPDHALVCLPYSLEANDFSLILTRHLSPREYAMALESHITQLAKESRDSGCPTVVCLGLHTFVAGTPAVVHELDKMLTRLKHRAIDNITWTTAEQVSTRVRKRQDEDKVSLIHHSIIPSPSLVPVFEAQESVLNMLGQSNSCPLTICATPSSVEVNCNSLGLILIDIQNDFMSSGGFGEKLGNDPTKLSSIIAPTKDVLKCARTAGLTVIHTREGHRPNLADVTQLKAKGSSSIGMNNGKGRSLVRGEWGSEFVAGLEPLCSETIIDKPGKGSFYQTDLDLVLRNANIDTLIVCGVTTEVCVHSTVRDATDRGIRCIVLKDCTASYFDEFHRIGLEMISAQGGIFGFVSDSKSIINAFTDDGIA
jgi:nicotinamidase-related amidase